MEMNEENEAVEKGNKKTVIIVCAVAAVLLVAAGLILFLVFGGKNKDKTKVAKALYTLVEDNDSYRTDIISDEEEETIINSILSGNITCDYSINLDGIEELPTTLGIDGSLTRLYGDKKLESTDSVSVMNISLADMIMYAEGTALYVQIPKLSDSVFMISDTSSLADDFNSSVLASLTGQTLPDECNFNLFPETPVDEISLTDGGTFAKDNAEELSAVYERIEVEHEKEKVTFTANDGSELTCTVYDMVIPADAANDLLKLSEMLEDHSVDSDVKLKFSVDENGYIREIATDGCISADGESITADILFCGAEVETDDIKINGNYSYDGMSVDYTADITRDTAGGFDIDAAVTGDHAYSIAFSGSRAYDENTGILACDIEKLKIEEAGDELFHVTGTCTIQNADGAELSKPSGDTIDIFNMDLMDMLDIATDIENNSDALSQAAELFGL